MRKLTNEQAFELFQTLNAIDLKEGSHMEYAATKTLRKMKEWSTKSNEKVKDLEDDFCATYKNDKGVEILLKKTLNRTNKDGVSEEFQVNEYTADGQKKKTEAYRAWLAKPVSVEFEIHTTSDGEGLTAYQKIALEELGFYTPAPEKEEDKQENTKKD